MKINKKGCRYIKWKEIYKEFVESGDSEIVIEFSNDKKLLHSLPSIFYIFDDNIKFKKDKNILKGEK